MMGDDPPYLSVGTEVSAKYKGAFCEAKIRKVVKSVKCKILFKQGLGIASVPDDVVKGNIRVGSVIEARHPERKEFIEGTITKIQDCSQYTVVFDDGDITTLRRTALCLKSGRHFAESETLDQLPLTHPEHFGNPVIGGRRGRRRGADSSDEEETTVKTKAPREEKEADIGRVVCVEGDKKKQRDNWFPGLVVAPTAQDTVRIHVREEYLVRSFKDGRYYTVPKKETNEFTREAGAKVDNHSVKAAVEKALLFLDKDELPPHWDRDLLFGLNEPTNFESDHDTDSDNPDDEPREEKDHFVAQLYKFMDDRGTPINQGPTICSRDVDLYRLFYVVHNLGGYNRVTNHNHWKVVSRKLGYGQSPVNVNLVKHVYRRFLHSFEEFYRKLGCTMVNHPRTYRNRSRSGRSLIRDKDRLSISGGKRESKDRSDADESEEASIAGSLGTLQDVDIKMEIEETIPEPPPPPPVAPPPKPKVVEIKEEPVPKKIVEKEKPPVIKIKEEKKEEEVKPKTDIVEPVKEKPRMRRTKLKTNSTTPETTPVKKEIKKEPEVKEELKPVEKEKKKRLFTRGLKKEKGSLMKCGPGLAITRQKRAIKERVKAFVDKFKFRLTKEPPPPPSEIVEKPVVPIKEKPVLPIKEKPPKIKEETPSTSTTVVKKKEEMPKEAGPPIEEKKKVGRKKKEKKDQDEPFDSLPTYKSVCVGDKLKVYYGPTHESKVTYEAKVLSIKTDGPEVMYLVHYTGWNNRYDEYIKHSRIADNLSWVPGRAAKKPSMSFLKPGRRKNSISKSENPMKTEGGMNKEGGPNMGKPDGPPPPNNQNKITKSVTVTRSSSRNSKKDEPLSEADEDTDCSMPSLYMDEFMCEKTHNQIVKEILGISDESNLVNVTEKRKMKRGGTEEASKSGESKMEQKGSDDSRSVEETTPSPKMDRRREKRTPQSEQESQEGEKKTRLISRRRRSSSTNEEKSDNNISADPDSTSSADEKKKTRNRSALDSPESGGTPRKRRFADKKSDIKPIESTSQHSASTDEESTQKSSGPDAEDASKGRDFDLIQIRSELKGLDKALKAEEEPFKSITAESKSASEKKAENDKLAEDIYEFKEPEPFEFEVRKSSDDKGKPQRRPLGRLFDDSKKHSSVLLPNIFYKGKKENKAEEPNKSYLNSIYNFEIESFEKITSSPRRLAEETSCKPIQLFTDSPDEDNNEEETKKSPNPLLNVTYNVAKDDIFNTTFTKNEDPVSPGSASPKSTSPIDADINENSNFDSNEVESTSKSCFSRDDDEDELEDESINFAIQRAIKQDISDDEDMPPHPPSMIQIESSIFSGTDEKIMDKPVIVEAVNADDKDAFENCEIIEKNDKSEGEDKSDDHISTGSDIESDFILTSGDRDEENLQDSVTVENITVAAIVTSPVIVANTLVEDSIVVETAELEATTSILTPITVPADIKDDTIEFSANEGDIEELGDEAIFPLSSPPDNKSNDEPLIEPIAATVQVETNESDHSNTDMDAINEELHEEEDEDEDDDDDDEEEDDDDEDVDEEEEDEEEEEGFKIESDCEFTFKPITVPPPDESESTVSIPFNDGKPEQDEIIINLEPLRSEKESKVDIEDDGKADLNLASLLCEETIPGSPSSHVECTEQTDEEKIDVPTVEIIEQKIERIEEIMTLPIVEEIVRTEEPLQASAESVVSSPSNSPRAERSGSPPAVDNDSSKSLRECEMDLENFVDQKEESEDDSKIDKTPTKPEIVRKVGSIKRTKPIKKQHCETVKRRYKRSRHTGSESDDTSENSISANPCYSQSSVIPPLNTDPKDAHTSEAIKSCKYNFLVALDPHMDQNTRIGMLQTSIQQIRKVYADLKSELAVVDRRRKKLRKRERENLAAVRLH